MNKRKKIPISTQSEVLTASARRCCVCYGIEGDFREKPGQITHLDHNPSNYGPDNLAWMCLVHHDRYDSTTSQSKGLTIDEVKRYRELLYRRVLESLPRECHKTTLTPTLIVRTAIRSQITELLSNAQSQALSLSQCLAEALAIADMSHDKRLEQFCRQELLGYLEHARKSSHLPEYRDIEMFVTVGQEINFDYIGWKGNASSIIDYMRRNPNEFHLRKLIFTQSVSELEALRFEPNKMLIRLHMNASHFRLKVKNAENVPVTAYARAEVISTLLESIRRELTQHLLRLLSASKKDT